MVADCVERSHVDFFAAVKAPTIVVGVGSMAGRVADRPAALVGLAGDHGIRWRDRVLRARPEIDEQAIAARSGRTGVGVGGTEVIDLAGGYATNRITHGRAV